MLALGIVLFREALLVRHAKGVVHRFGPFATLCLAVPLILADPTRHLLGDLDLWAECGNNGVHQRINSSDPFPEQCRWSSAQYHCSEVCCVPVWIGQPRHADEPQTFGWSSPQSSFFPAVSSGQFATLRADGSLFTPPPFDESQEPFRVFRAPLLLFANGERNAGVAPEDCAPFGVNPDTGYCLLTNASLPYEEQLRQLPRPRAEEPYDAESNAGHCDCDSCTAVESFSHLSTVGILFTIGFTYCGFALLSAAVLWNANIVQKLRRIGDLWRQQRAPPAERLG